MNTYKIYKWTNLITSKGYVGQTCLSLPIRAGGRNMTGYRSCSAFWEAIQEYGTDCWHIEILWEGFTAAEADVYEDIEIKNHGTLTPNGYNLKDRDTGCQSRKSIELRENTSFICKSYLEGVSAKVIAKRLGCSYPTILTILHENNVRVYHSNQEKIRTDLREKASFICKSYLEGLPVKEIAKRLECCTASIYKILRENGVQMQGSKRMSKGKLGMRQEAFTILVGWLLRDGWSHAKIARELRKSEGTIAKYAKRVCKEQYRRSRERK